MLRGWQRLRAKRLFRRTMDGVRLGSTPYGTVLGLKKDSARAAAFQQEMQERQTAETVSEQVKLQSKPQAKPLVFWLPQVGFVVSKKVEKRATQRNKVKRRLRMIFRELLEEVAEQYGATGSHALYQYRSIVVLVRPTAVGCDYAHLRGVMRQVMLGKEAV